MSAIDTVLTAAGVHGEVKRAGNKFKTRCPVHGDEHPSCDIEEKGGVVVVKCRSKNCAFKDIAAGWGLKERDFFPPKHEPTNHKGIGPLVATYLYESIFGKLAFKSCRYQFPGSHDKTFLLFRPDGNGGWTAGLKGVERIPFGLPELMAAGPDETIFILEGEKIVILARDKLGIVATTNPGGAGGSNLWKTPAFRKAVQGKNVVLVPDNDQPGEKHMATIAASIVDVAKSVKIVRLPLKNEGDDLEQYLAAGGTREQLLALVEAAPLYDVETATAAEPEEPESICLATVEPCRVGWLWFGRLPSGEMVVITGRPGVGKGLLLCYVVSRYTTGRPMHGDRVALAAGHVLWISIEDAIDTSLVPRLMAAGADLSRVHAWNLTRPLSLPVDADRIVAELKRLGCTMLIIDPAPTLLDKDHSSNNDANVRQSFAALSAACRELGCTMILVRHTNKRTVGDAMERGGGSIGWTGMARIELMLGRRPVEEGATVVDTHESVATFATVKNNLGRWAPSLNIAIIEAADSARVEIIGETKTTADDLCAPDKPRTARKTGDAEELIRLALADGQWHRQREIMDAAERAEIGERTLKRAKAELPVQSQKRSDGWWWRLANSATGEAVPPWPPCPVGEAGTVPSYNNEHLGSNRATGPHTHTPGPVTQEGQDAEDAADLGADFNGDASREEDAV
jgi:hypothetical protein